jgi:type II secretory pathway pseudopilin PulG
MSRAKAPSLSVRPQETERRNLTLVELLAAIAALGILAAAGTFAMVAITALGQQKAAASEKAMVQRALETMLADQGVDAGSGCSDVRFKGGQAPDPKLIGLQSSTRNMSQFPVDAPYRLPQSGRLVALYPHYLGEVLTRGHYHCSTSKSGRAATRTTQAQQDDYSST